MSIDFYQRNASDFFDRTVQIDMSGPRDRFAAGLRRGAKVLDAGCGSGRDARAFHEMGFQVTAIEAAPALAALARAETGLPVEVMTFDQIAWRGAFDGIWACASLLHVPREHLADTLTRLRDALAPNGLLWMSFKLGTQDRRESGRLFTDMNQDGVTALLAEVGGLALLEMVISDGRGYQADIRWLAVTCRRST